MGRNNQRKNESKGYNKARAKAMPQLRLMLSRHVLIAVLIMLLAFGVVTISFSYISSQNILPDDGPLLMSVRSKAVSNGESGSAADIEPAQADNASEDSIEASDNSSLAEKDSDIALTGADSDLAVTGAAALRYIYVGISYNYEHYKDSSKYGFNFWGGTSGGVKSGTYLDTYDHDGRTYYMYRVQVYDDNNKAQFKGNDSWYDPNGGYSVTLNGVTNNAVFFSHSNDGWGGQFQENYQETSTASLSGPSSTTTGTSVQLTPSLTSNATYNEIKSTTYTVSTNPNSAGFVSSSGEFTASSAGTYKVTATVTYNPKKFTGITKTATATKTITVTGDDAYYLLGFGTGESYWGSDTNGRMVSDRKMTKQSDGKYRLTYSLAEQTYSNSGNDGFKVFTQKNTTWYGHDGTGYDMTRSNSGPWTMNTAAGKGNIGVVADVAGDYIFEFNPSAKNIRIYYPNIITFNKNGHGGTNTSAVVTYGQTATEPAAPTATGYTFGGWYTDSDCTTAYDFSTAVTQDTTVYAKWTAKSYTVTLNNGSGTPATSTVSATYDAVMPKITSLPTRTGYNFAGYYDGQNGSGTQYYNANGTAYNNKKWNKTNNNPTLYAKWTPKTSTVNIYQNYNDSDNTLITTVTATYDAAMPSIASHVPSRTGYTLRGFYTTRTGGNNADMYYKADGTSNLTWDKEDATFNLYAQWTINSYDVTFRGQYRSGSSTYTYTEPSPAPTFKINDTPVNSSNNYKKSLNYDTTVNLSIVPEAYYQFDGIYKGSTKVSDTESYSFKLGASNVTYYARYTQKPVVTLNYTYSNPDTSVEEATNASTFVFTASTEGGVSSAYTYKYYYKIGNGNYTLIDDPTSWMPPQAKQTYSFKVVSTSTNGTDTYTGEKEITGVYVDKYEVYYSVTVNNTGVKGTETLTQHDSSGGSDETTVIDNNQVLGGTQLNLKIDRPATKSDYYISSVTVSMGGTTVYSLNDNTAYLNSDFADLSVITKVTGNIVVTYNIAHKPQITLTPDSNISEYQFVYRSEGQSVTASSAGSYYVDYGSNLTYKVTPSTGYYVDNITASPSAGMTLSPTPPTKNAVTASINNVTHTGTVTLAAVINSNRGLTVTITDKPPGCTNDGTLKISDVTKQFDTKYSYDYNDPQTVEITPPTGYYVSEVTVTSNDHDTLPAYNHGSYTITGLRIKDDDVIVNVKYAANPVINIQQPQYGSVYVTTGSTAEGDLRYYFNGDTVEFNTELQVHAVKDTSGTYKHWSGGSAHTDPVMVLNSITANNNAIQSGGANLLPASGVDFINYNIKGDTVFSANISYAFESADMPAVEGVDYRRIFFTDNKNWGNLTQSGGTYDHTLYVHYSNSDSDYKVAAENNGSGNSYRDLHNVKMTFLYVNEDQKNIYYADIPYTYNYVMFNTGYDPEADTGATRTYLSPVYSEYKALTTANNAFSSDIDSTATTNPRPMSNDWTLNYPDYRTVGSAGDYTQYDAQQKIAGKNSAAVFRYDCDNVNSLTIDKIYGCTCDFSYGNGYLRITPTPADNEPNYAFVKVTSDYTRSVKYYLVKVSMFELRSFEAIQRLFNPDSFKGTSSAATTIALKVISKGFGIDNPNVSFSYSLHNNNDYTELTGTPTHEQTTIENITGFILSKLNVTYSDYNFEGVNYFKTTVSDDNAEDSREQKTVFGLSNNSGDSVLYFKTDRVDLSAYNLVARFTIADNSVWSTMVPVSGNLYRVMIPAAATRVRFYLMYPDKFSTDVDNVDETYNGRHVYYYSASSNIDIAANQVFIADTIDNSEISGSFAAFNN